jgi:enoyl-CoA hydratase/carnithine racemase
MDEAQTMGFVSNIQKTFQEIAELPIPTIAAINGDAFGGGLELALACDLRVLNSHAHLGLTECSLGIIPGAGGTQRLPRIIGFSRAMDLIFLARRIDAQEAKSMGLVNYVKDGSGATRGFALELAHKIAQNAPLAVRSAKEAILVSQEKSLSDGLVAERASYHEILETSDRREGLMAFQEKRPPRFRGA